MPSHYQPGRGVHFTLFPEEEAQLVDEPHIDVELREILGEIEVRRDPQWRLGTDKAWDGLHRCLTDGTLRHGTTPLHRCVIGSDNLGYQADDYIISYVLPDEVPEVAAAISKIDEPWLRQRFFALDPQDYALSINESGFRYVWHALTMLQQFYHRAATANRATVFTAAW